MKKNFLRNEALTGKEDHEQKQSAFWATCVAILLRTFQFFPRDPVTETRREHVSAHAAFLVENTDKGFYNSYGGRQGGQCFGKEMEKEGNSQQGTPFPYDHLWK